MTHSPADVIRRMLIDLGMGLDPPSTPWPVYATGEPPAPDNCLTVYDSQGFDGGRAMVGGQLLGFVGFQVRVRSVDHNTGWSKADAIQQALAETVYQELVHVASSNYLVHDVCKIGDVLSLGTESPTSKRRLFTINAAAAIRQL